MKKGRYLYFAALGLALTLGSCKDDGKVKPKWESKYYANSIEAQNSYEEANGWVPFTIPPSGANINAIINYSDSTVFLEYIVSQDVERPKFFNWLQKASNREVLQFKTITTPPDHTDWWKSSEIEEKLKSGEYTPQKTMDETNQIRYYISDHKTGKVYSWAKINSPKVGPDSAAMHPKK